MNMPKNQMKPHKSMRKINKLDDSIVTGRPPEVGTLRIVYNVKFWREFSWVKPEEYIMADTKVGMRYAHSEGHTSLCYDDTGNIVLTCGGDGDVRMWKDLVDDDPEYKHVGDNAYSIVFKNKRFMVATDANSILAYTFPDSSADGLITRFAGPVNHMCLSKDGAYLLAGSSDFSMKVVKVLDNSFKVLLGHTAPVLSVDLDPLMEFAASSSCDGSVRIWKIAKQACVKSWANMVPTSNDFCASTVLCRLAWQPVDGKILAVPTGKSVKIFSRDSWNEATVLADESITEAVNLVKFSDCGRYLAGACVNGVVVVWDVDKQTCIKREKHEKRLTICSLQWNPKGNGEMAFCDVMGNLCVLINMLDTSELAPISVPSTEASSRPIFSDKVLPDDPFDDDFPPMDDDDDDENTFSISKIKAETVGLEHFSDDEDDLGVAKKAADVDVAETEVPVAAPRLTDPTLLKLGQMQEPFQPGSTPVYYRHRFMTWNSVGIVRGYNTEDESAMDVEFHDTATHHSLHLDNALEHTMADLSSTAVLLACKAKNGNPSKLVCNNFGAWGSNKEWTIDMVDGENIEAIAVGSEWAAASTDQRHLRLFNVGGIQRHVVAVPGPVVAMSGHMDELVVVFHQGMGIPGDQCLSMMRLNLANRNCQTSIHSLPLSPKSTLAWIGFTDEGNPCCSDSAGVVRYLPRSLGQAWVQIANTKSHTKGKSDNYFVVGLSESQQQIRCILCKGARYPSTLPHPMVTVLSFELPLCGLSSEKGKLEESYWRHSLLLDTFAYLDEQGYETDPILADRSKKSRKEDLIKLFALSCRGDREFCALELAQMMDSHQTVQLAIKYASRQKRLQLAERVGEVAYHKMEEEEAASVAPATRRMRESSPDRPSLQHRRPISSIVLDTENGGDYHEEFDSTDIAGSSEMAQDLPTKPVVFSGAEWSNPFRTSLSTPTRDGLDGKRSSILDNLPMSSTPKAKPTSSLFKPNQPKLKSSTSIPPAAKLNVKVQKTLQQFGKKENKSDDAKETTPPTETSKSPKPQKSGYQLWLDANTDSIRAENSDLTDDKFAMHAVKTFKKLSPEDKQIWNDLAKAKKENVPDVILNAGNVAKRKREMAGPRSDPTKMDDQPNSPDMFEDHDKRPSTGATNKSSVPVAKRKRSEKSMANEDDDTGNVDSNAQSTSKENADKSTAGSTVEKKKEASKKICSKLSSFAFKK